MWHQKLLDLSAEVANAETDEVFWNACCRALGEAGITGFGFGMIPYATDARFSSFSKAGFFKHTYCREWASALGEGSLPDNDSTIEMVIDGVPEIFWHDASLLDGASSSQLAQTELENDLGMRFGATLALGANSMGQAISGVGLWVGDVVSDDDFDTYWQEHGERLRQICQILDAGIRGPHAGSLVALTPREQDCLSYIAIGLRPAEICWHLAISEKTLEKHIMTAKSKLGAKTRDHAVAKALVLNLIQP
jgi:DNA-binding CsgD family transcriptional regulator